ELLITDDEEQPAIHAFTGQEIRVRLTCETARAGQQLELGISVFNDASEKIFHLDSGDCGAPLLTTSTASQYVAVIPALPLPEGNYRLDVRAQVNGDLADELHAAATLSVSAGDFYGSGRASLPRGAMVFCPHRWEPVVETQ